MDAARVIGWLLLSSAFRLGAAAAAASALGAPRPLAAAAIIVPALEVSSLVPLTPGNVGVTSGVVAVALKAQGLDTTTALAAGIAFHAIETAVGIGFGLFGVVKVYPPPLPAPRRLAAAAAMLTALVAGAAVALDVA